MSIVTKRTQGKQIAQQHIDRKLRIRLLMYSAILLIMAGVSVYELLSYTLSIWYVMIGLGLGMGLGLIACRMFNIVRHPNSEQVISRMDKRGIAILVIYIIIELNKNRLFMHWLKGNQLDVFGWVFLVGIFAGRLRSMSRSITSILISKEKISTQRL